MQNENEGSYVRRLFLKLVTRKIIKDPSQLGGIIKELHIRNANRMFKNRKDLREWELQNFPEEKTDES